MIKKINSGGQSGADIAALITGKKLGIETGGWMPKGFKTLNGLKPQYKTLYNVQEHQSAAYPPRTYLNVKESDGTLRFAADFNSPGEICTWKAIQQYNKPYWDVNICELNNHPHLEVVDWIISNNINILNVAGNSEKTYMGITAIVCDYLEEVIRILDEQFR